MEAGPKERSDQPRAQSTSATERETRSTATPSCGLSVVKYTSPRGSKKKVLKTALFASAGRVSGRIWLKFGRCLWIDKTQILLESGGRQPPGRGVKLVKTVFFVVFPTLTRFTEKTAQ